MTVAVLGSGSRGNAVAIATPQGILLVDAGFGPRTLKRRLAAAGLPREPILGIVLTHEHGDHARGAVALARRTLAPLIATAGTLAALRVPLPVERVVLPRFTALTFGAFTIEACPVPHDAAEPVAVAIDGPGGRVGVALDVGRATRALELLLRDCRQLVVESNHDDVMLRIGRYPPSVRSRIAGSGGHLSNRAAAELLATVCAPTLETVVLAHLSAHCNTPALARASAVLALRRRGFAGTLLVAEQDRPVALPWQAA